MAAVGVSPTARHRLATSPHVTAGELVALCEAATARATANAAGWVVEAARRTADANARARREAANAERREGERLDGEERQAHRVAVAAARARLALVDLDALRDGWERLRANVAEPVAALMALVDPTQPSALSDRMALRLCECLPDPSPSGGGSSQGILAGEETGRASCGAGGIGGAS